MDQNHAFFIYKNKGMSRQLRGKVLVELVFVSDQQSFWTHREIESFYSVHQRAMNHLQQQATAAGAPLSIITLQGQVTCQGSLDTKAFDDFYYTIRKQFLRQRSFEDYETYVSTRKRSYQVDEVAIIFVLEQRFRAFAHPSQEFEYCVVTQESDVHAIAHELLHLFGAVDLYYPYHIYGLTMKYFPKSLMCTLEGMEVDPLNQYLIGWTAELSPKAKIFVEKLSDHTEDRYYAALTLEYLRNREDELLEDACPFESVSHIQRTCRTECDPWAEFLLGLCYLHGIGMAQDLKMAEKHFASGGRTGLIISAVAHAQMLILRGVSTPQDRENLSLLLDNNSCDHMKLVSLRLVCRFKGLGFPKDPNLAAHHTEFYHKEREQHLSYYQRSGRLYRVAERYSQNIPELRQVVEKMRTRYEQMLETGDPDLIFLAAQVAEKKAKNQKERYNAVVLYDQAARGNNYRACEELARCYREGYGTAQNLDYARQWSEYAQYCREINPHDAFCHMME